MNADGTGETPVTSPAPNAIATPTWSPDGQRIAYTAYAGGQNDIWVVNADGSGHDAAHRHARLTRQT